MGRESIPPESIVIRRHRWRLAQEEGGGLATPANSYRIGRPDYVVGLEVEVATVGGVRDGTCPKATAIGRSKATTLDRGCKC